MVNEYEIYTSIRRDFDPEIEGMTIDSIMESSKGYITHSVPECTIDGNTLIRIETEGKLEEKYIRGQLESEFLDCDEDGRGVVREIKEVTM